MNHNHRKPYIPLPPALPRFALPNDPNDASDASDPLDAAATSQRPALPALARGGTRRVVRRVRPKPDATEEVAVEDILLEVYAEDPPPPMSRRVRTPPASASIASAIASVVPPSPHQSAAVDALLRASDPAFAPSPAPLPPQGQGYVHVASYVPMPPMNGAYGGMGPDFETPSVAPVTLATTHPPQPAFGASAPLGRPIIAARRTNRGAVFAIWSAVVLVLAVASGAGIFFGMRDGFFARSYARLHSKPSEPVVAAATPAAPPAAPPVNAAPESAPAPATAPAPAPTPTVSIDALPKSPIPADVSFVTFPSYAQGHRVFVDGRVVAIAEGGPTKMKCGRHMMKIGTARKARQIDLACGSEVVIQ